MFESLRFVAYPWVYRPVLMRRLSSAVAGGYLIGRAVATYSLGLPRGSSLLNRRRGQQDLALPEYWAKARLMP